jgi:hypothetical protein
VKEYVVEDVGEELERELVEVIEEIQFVEDEEQVTTRLSEWQVFVRDLFDLCHDRVRLFHLSSDFGSFSFECF